MSPMSAVASDLTAPVLLVAMPQVQDPTFHRSVVLLVRHEEEGSFGFIVNRATELRLQEVLEGMEVVWQGADDAVAHLGGPVQQHLGTVLFAPGPVETEADTEVHPGIALTQHIGDLVRLAEAPPPQFRLLLGYAGWGAGQLIEEILRNDWLTAPVHSDLVFAADPGQVWADALRSMGVDPVALPSWTPGGGGETAN
jgi:putative transcriptional regulator